MNVYIGTSGVLKNAYIGEWWTPGSNTVAYYPLTENANDYSGNGYNATNIGATFSSDGAYFGTYDKRIALPTMTIGQTATINTWVKTPNGFSGNLAFDLYFDWSSSYRNIIWEIGSAGVYGNTGNNSTTQHNFSISGTFGTGWTNMVLVKTGTTVTIYKNGTQIGTNSSSYNVTLPGGRNTVTIGHNTMMSSSTGAVGYLKDYIIEKRAWTSTEILNYYNLTKSTYGL